MVDNQFGDLIKPKIIIDDFNNYIIKSVKPSPSDINNNTFDNLVRENLVLN